MEMEVMEIRRVKEREKDIMIAAKLSNWKDKKEIMARKNGLEVGICIKVDDKKKAGTKGTKKDRERKKRGRQEDDNKL